MGIRSIIIYYSALAIGLGLVCFFILREDPSESAPAKGGEANKATVGKIISALKQPSVWFVSMILLCTYSMNMSYKYFTPYATKVFGVTAVFAAVLSMLAQYVRPVASPLAGFISDKIGRPNLMIFGFIVMGIGTVVTVMLPSSTNTYVLAAICAVIYIAMFMNYGVVFSLMDTGNIPLEISGIASGIICTVGYLPEVICPTLAGKILDQYDAAGYSYYFTGIAVLMAVGIVTILIWKKVIAKQNATKSEQ